MRKFWFLIFLLSALSMTGQVYNVTKYSTDEGLVQSQVMCMVQDNRGYLWLGTHRGIDRFDGQKFKHFGIQEGLAGNFVADIVEDGERTFWIATDNGLSLFDGLRFKNFGSEEGFSENTIECLAMDPNGYLWLGTQSKGLMAFDREERMVKDLDLPSRLVNQGITALTWDSQDQLWIGTRSGLWMRDRRGAFHKVSHPKLPTNLVIEEIFEGVQGQMLLGTTTGLYHYDGQTYHSYNPKSIGLDMRVFAVLQDRTGKVWIGTGNGLAWLEQGELTILDKSGRNLDIRVTSGLLDNEGNIWFGTDGGGVRKVTEGVFEAYTVQNEMSSNLAKSFLEDNEGRIWISTKDQGINVYEGRKKVRTYNQENGLGGNDICSSMEDSQGNFWFASYNGTLTKYRNGEFQVIDASDGLDCNSVYWVTEIGRDTLWIGTDNGLFVWEKNRVTRHYTDADGLPTNIIYHILAESPSQIWLGTAMGLVEYAEGRFRLIEAPHAIGKNVLSILKDKNGTLWIGSVKGLAAMRGDSTHFIKISGAPGAHTIVGLVMEADQYLWVATENGAYRLSVSGFDPLKRNSFEHYTQKDGLPSLECNANAAFTDKEGAVWLGTAEGAIHRPLNTERQRLRFPPKVYVTGIQNQEGLDWINEGFKVDEGGLPMKLELPYSDNRLSFEYIGISLKSPKQVEYRFMLEGIDNDWLRPTRQTEVFYPNLNPGKYTFKVVAKRETEPWDYDHPAEFSFEILSPFWQ
ncbi:MAG: two-component regulator propeller domain-containing protein, partial [Bacteroidota bacterium]